MKTDETIKGIFKLDVRTKVLRPLVGTRVAAGFPSPAQDYIEDTLDLNEHLITHPASTFFVKVDGDSMIDAGIYPDDMLIVDRSLEAANNKIVIAFVNNELTVKRLSIVDGKYFLIPANHRYPKIEIEEWMDMTVWGVVTYVIRKL